MKKTMAILIIMLMPNILAVEYIYDDNDFLIGVDYELGDAKNGVESVRTEFDPKANEYYEITTIREDGEKIEKVKTSIYDGQGRLTVQKEEGREISYKYDPNDNVVEIKENSNIDTFVYDQEGKVICENCDGAGNGIEAFYTYDDDGRVKSLERGSVKESYDSSGRLIEESSSDGLKIIYTYDELGNLKEVQKPGQEPIIYNACGTLDNFKRDGNCNILEDGIYRYTHNPFNQIETATEKATGDKTTYTYDDQNRLIQVAYPDSTVDQYTYNGGLYSLRDRQGIIFIELPDGSVIEIKSKNQKIRLAFLDWFQNILSFEDFLKTFIELNTQNNK